MFDRKIVKKNSNPSVLTYVLGAQKNRLIGTVLLMTRTYDEKNCFFGTHS